LSFFIAAQELMNGYGCQQVFMEFLYSFKFYLRTKTDLVQSFARDAENDSNFQISEKSFFFRHCVEIVRHDPNSDLKCNCIEMHQMHDCVTLPSFKQKSLKLQDQCNV
jgi:hypothetical protein